MKYKQTLLYQKTFALMAPLISLFSIFLLNLFNILFSCNALPSNYSTSLPKFSSILIFGDSLLDTGNNNYVPTTLQANHAPYGVSFPGGVATGRFSDGKLMSDFLAEALGLKEIVPPFLDPNLPPSELLTGVCFASAGAGYDENTDVFAGVIPVTRQYKVYFKEYKQKLIAMVGENRAANILETALVFATSGSNDVLFNTYANAFTPPMPMYQYQDYLIGNIEKFIKSLYKDGLRKMAIAGLPPICGILELGGPVGCALDPLSDAHVYNSKLQAKLLALQSSLPGSRIVYADIFTPLKQIATNPIANGIYVPIGTCCGSGLPTIGLSCDPFVSTCPNPAQYFMWDSIHPTQTVYRYMSEYLINNVLPQFSS